MAKQNKAKHNDELEDLTATESFIDQYKKPLITGVGILVVVILGIVGYQKLIADPHEKESRDAYWNAFYEFEKDSLDLAVNGSNQFTGMSDVASEYAGTSGGNIATYTMGINAMEKGNYSEAIGYFEDCSFEDIMLGTFVIGLQGDCYVEMDQYEDAADAFEKAADREPNMYTTPMYLKKAGLAYEALGNQEKALEVYKEIKEEWMKSDEAKDIEKYIARIEN